MLIRKLIVSAFVFLTPYAFSSTIPQAFHNPASTEITVSDLEWKNPDHLPQDLVKSKAYRTWLKNVWNKQPAWFAKINIDGNDKTQEVLIASSLSGSGGRNFLLIAQTKKHEWNELATIFGSPIFMKSKPSGYADLQTYHRNGLEMWLQLYKYSNGKYKFQTEALMPRAIVTECFYQRWLQLNLLGFSKAEEEIDKYSRTKMQSICPELVQNVDHQSNR